MPSLTMPSSTFALPFHQLASGIATGTPATPGWRAIGEFPMLILVGVTGVGKSTLLTELSRNATSFWLLPDRRRLTDELIIRTMQVAEGSPVTPVSDRSQRFAYTRRYRELYEGGMAHALAQLWVSADAPNLLVFDGLRGDNEVRYAAATLPQARFVMLDAPELVRLQRLLGRNDAFDRVRVEAAADAKTDSFVALGVPDAASIFDAAEEATILDWIRQGIVTPDEVRAKLRIVTEERRNYDPQATLRALQTHAPQATLYIDTVAHAPAAVADQVIRWINPENL